MARFGLRGRARLAYACGVALAVASLVGGCSSGGNSEVSSTSSTSSAASESGGGTSDASTDSLRKVSVADSGASLLWGAMYVAREQGFFKQEGIDYDEVTQQNSTTVLNTVVSGDVPYALGSQNLVIQANAKSQHLVAIASITTGFPNTLVVNKEIASASGLTDASPLKDRLLALRGKKIAASTAGGPIDIVLREMLESAGLNPDRDVTIVYLNSPQSQVGGIKSGTVDAGIASSPWTDQGINDGYAVKWVDMTRGDYPPLADMQYSVLYARADYLKSHQEEAQSLVNAFGKALAFIQSDKDGSRSAVHKAFSDVDDAVFALAFDSTYPAFPKSVQIDEAAFDKNLRLTVAGSKDVEIKVTFDQAVDNTFADAYAKAHG